MTSLSLKLMVPLLPKEADRENGDWAIWMSHLTPMSEDIINIHRGKHEKKEPLPNASQQKSLCEIPIVVHFTLKPEQQEPK